MEFIEEKSIDIKKVEKLHSPVICGLPDDLSLICLSRVPRKYHGVLRCVSKRWRMIVSSPEFDYVRKIQNLAETWIYAFIRTNSGSICLYALDPDSSKRCWKHIGGCPARLLKRKGLAFGVLGKKLYLLGGCGWVCGITNEAHCFDASTSMWSEIAPMTTARCYFLCETLNNKLYAIGGMGTSNDLSSWDTYDPFLNEWTSSTDSHLLPDVQESVTFQGKIYVTHEGSSTSPNVECSMYDPSTNGWEPFTSNMMASWRGSIVVVDDDLYMLDESSGIKLMIWNNDKQDWITVGRLSPHLAKPPCRLAAVGKRIFVVGKGLQTVIIDVGKIQQIRGMIVCSSILGFDSKDEVVSCKTVTI